MNALSIFKSATELVVSVGTGTIVGNIIKSTTPLPVAAKNLRILRQFNQATVPLASLVISGFIGDLASKHAVAKIDDIAKQVSEVKAAVEEATGEVKAAIEDD